MTSFADTPVQRQNPLIRVEGWLDRRGRAGWIAAMVLGFVFVWPAGLALLAYMLWANKFSLSGKGCGMSRRMSFRQQTTGNAAFDAYRAETIRRLEEEQAAFEGFLKRLREARDKAEFDQFMAEQGKSKSDEDKDAA
ncbi:Protein of unknown function [Palleronia marisminoris]|uniref:DUF2852 domain-containing protein n=1 Tax=Palleronia marisminoris TaxID=315423 RepID=A0A1Y5RFB9_9RHOB|nr:DUF2852 domain-containing protein [Palleronia marisminoris]SFG16325.1 Protein of unknown function [Palleronia marisminoris]SLN16209.1 hypothetical protein PAM7066_00364 [Palleronia marisminoris]